MSTIDFFQYSNLNKMKTILSLVFLALTMTALAQENHSFSPFDARHWGVVLDHPDMNKVLVEKEVTYLQDEKGSLHIDLYLPPDRKTGEKYPAVIFLNGIGETAGQAKVKDWAIYSSWPKLMAAHGFIGIAMESDGNRIPESIDGLFKFLANQGQAFSIDVNRLGVYAASANVMPSAAYLMKETAYKGIKAAVLYYGGTPNGPYRKDLPVLFVVSEGDVGRNGYTNLWTEVLKNNAPWSVKMGTGLPHGFDAFEDSDEARIMIKETISFWKNHLDAVPQPAWSPSIPREILSQQYWQHHNQAADLAKQWLDSHPDDEDALKAYSASLKNANRFAEAEPIFKKRISQDPGNVNLLADLTYIMYGLGKSAEAENYMSRAMATGKLNRFHFIVLGRSLYNIKKYKESARYYEEAVKFGKNGVDYYNLACSYALAQEKDKAFLSLSQAIENGFYSKQHFESDSDLDSLKSDSRWISLLKQLK